MNNHQQQILAVSLSSQEQSNFLAIRRKAILTSKAFCKWQRDIANELKRIQLQHKKDKLEKV